MQNINSTLTNNMYVPYGTKVLTRVTVNETSVEIVYTTPSNAMTASMPSVKIPDSLEKQIYSIIDGKLSLTATEYGRLEPAKTVPAEEIWHTKPGKYENV